MVECKTCEKNLPDGVYHTCFRNFAPEAMSPDLHYCPECFEFLSMEASQLCVKSKKAKWIPRISGQDTPSKSSDTPQARRDDVTKITDKGILLPAEETGILLQGTRRGRPRKQGGEPVSRMTQWRRKREKEVQEVLL